jgi:hypothetical protein
MIEVGENLAFVAESFEHGVGVHTSLHDFDGDALLKLVIRADGQVHRAHSAVPQFGRDLIGPEALAEKRAVFNQSGRGKLEDAREFCVRIVMREKRFNLIS